MSIEAYMRERGTGPFAEWHVPDLVADDPGKVGLVFVFESPHTYEVAAGLPVVGASGRDALRYLTSSGTGQSLGEWVAQDIKTGRGRVAVLNVSNVPLQPAAFTGDAQPELEDEAWDLVRKVRSSRSTSVEAMRDAAARTLTETLVGSIKERLTALLGNKASVVVAGAFAQRMIGPFEAEIPGPILRVPHPSYGQWNRASNKVLPDMVEMRRLFGTLAT